MSYKGKGTKICAITPFIDVPINEKQDIYGVNCTHEVEKVKGREVHLMVATVPAELADEMVSNGRAHLYADIVKGTPESK